MSLHLGGNQPLFAREAWCGSKLATPSAALPVTDVMKPAGQTRQRRALKDISNHAALKKGASWDGLDSQKRPCLGAQAVAPRRSSSFTVFDDSMDMDCSNDAPTRTLTSQAGFLASLAENVQELPGKSAPSYQRGLAGADRASLMSDPPCVQDFLFPIDEQEQYDRAMCLDECEGFGTPAELAASLFKSAQSECFQASALSQMPSGPWDVLRDDLSSPAAAVWPAPFSPAPFEACDSGSFQFSPLELPELPQIEMDMGSDDDIGCTQQPMTERRLLF